MSSDCAAHKVPSTNCSRSQAVARAESCGTVASTRSSYLAVRAGVGGVKAGVTADDALEAALVKRQKRRSADIRVAPLP